MSWAPQGHRVRPEPKRDTFHVELTGVFADGTRVRWTYSGNAESMGDWLHALANQISSDITP